MKRIEIIIDTKGQAHLETKGFVGASCREASRLLEEALGRRTAEQVTAEFHEVNTISQQHRQGG